MEHYSLPSDHEYNGSYSGHAHSAFSTGSAVELRRDSTAAIQTPAPFTFHSTNGASAARFDPARGVASDSSSYQTSSNNFTDSSSGSISSPSSAASSSLAYTTYPHTQCTSLPSYSGAVQPPQAFAQLPSYASTRELPNLDSIGTGMPPPSNPIRSSFSSTATDREAYANSTPFLTRTQLSPGSTSGYPSFSDTPRTALALNGLSLSNNPYGHMASSPTYGGQQNDCNNFPWPTLEIHAEMTCDGQSITPEVHAKVEKGFFLSTVDQKWTCYRRNYFSVQCSFELHPTISNGRMHLKRTNSQHSEAIQAMGMRLSAAVDGSGGKCIELVQHTPKRDAGPKNKIDVTKVLPLPSTSRNNEHTVSPHGVYPVAMSPYHATGHPPGPYLPLQNAGDGSTASSTATAQASGVSTSYGYTSTAAAHLPLPGQNTNHTFERVQFKQATANNGKRRASQQYFHLIVELFADVRKDGSNEASWVKVAHRSSEKIVVRGRSPSHYQNEGQHQNGRSGSTSGGSGYGAPGGSTFGNLTTGGFRQSSTSFGGGLSGGNYRTNAYGYQASPDNSGSSASSVDGGADNEYQADSVMSDAERNDIQTHEGYRYYPGPLYEGVQPGLPLPKIESGARFSTEPSQWAVKYESSDPVAGSHWSQLTGGISRFQGVESSRGYYSDQLAATYSG